MATNWDERVASAGRTEIRTFSRGLCPAFGRLAYFRRAWTIRPTIISSPSNRHYDVFFRERSKNAEREAEKREQERHAAELLKQQQQKQAMLAISDLQRVWFQGRL